MKYQGLRQVYKIVEYRKGMVYRTEPIGYAWITIGDKEKYQDGDKVYASISTRVSIKLKHNQLFRRVSDDIADYVETKIPD
jgi:predicted SPOUT superfamily RNA methylase MTH1